MKHALRFAWIACVAVPSASFAVETPATPHHDHAAMMAKEAPKPASAPAAKPVAKTDAAKPACIDRLPAVGEYRKAMDMMHRDMNVTYTGDPDIDFAKAMVPHHLAAIEMAKTELKYGADENMRDLAEWIIQGQQQEVAMMTHWLAVRNHFPGPGTPRQSESENNQEAVAAYKLSMEPMHRDMMGYKYTGDTDMDFAQGMIPHHQGAVDMAYVLLKYGKNLELKRLAENIINSQQQEIGRMKRWVESEKASAPKPATTTK